MKKEYDLDVLRRRSDVSKILEMPEHEFHEWYWKRVAASERLLQDYRITSSIPCFLNQHIETTNWPHGGAIRTLEKGLEYLAVIKEMRDGKE